MRRDFDALEAGVVRVGADARDITEQPLANGTQRIVVERVHAGVLKSFFGSPAVPAFPDRGGAVPDRKSPRRKRVLLQQLVGNVVVAGGRQRRAQIAHADKTRRKMIVLRFDVVHQMPCGERAHRFGQQIETQCEQIRRLCAAFDLSIT